jgi:hypothetical protein
MEIKRIKQISAVLSSMCYSAAFAFVSSLVFEISTFGTLLAFLLIFCIIVSVEFLYHKERRIR